MVIHGDQDTTNPIEASKKMADAAKAAGVGGGLPRTVSCGTSPSRRIFTYASQIFDFWIHTGNSTWYVALRGFRPAR
jgi:hypothetical protein